jgi:thiamine-monophosphate kinase
VQTNRYMCPLTYITMSHETSNTRSEFQLIEWIKDQSQSRPEIQHGIGDDAAVLNVSPGSQVVTAVDVITEGVHFTAESDPFLIGRKALAINLSDIAAMGAKPVAAFVGIVLPKHRDRSYAEEIYRGLFELANQYNVTIAGGDTNSWDGGLVISVTVQGVVPKDQAVLRSGAKPGDWIFVTGSLGGSLPSGRHFTFEPKLKASRILFEHFRPTAMLDISDGIASDIRHIANQSNVGVILNASEIPIHEDVNQSLNHDQRLQHALCDGEDFELLLSVSPETGERLLSDGKRHGLKAMKIGECTKKKELVLSFGEKFISLPAGGWIHQTHS